MKTHLQRTIKWRNVSLAIAGLLLIAAAVYFSTRHYAATRASVGGPGMGGPGISAPTPVHSGTAQSADVPVYLSALGTVVANASVTVTSRVDGQLMRVYFIEGQKVAQGQLLAQIDPRSYQATLDQYQGELAQNQALLQSAQLTLVRYKTLFAQDSLARQDLESQTATVGQYQGAVTADVAQINAAKLNLDYARITAPVSGRVGLRLVDPGNMVRSSDTTGIVTITQTQPIAVTFSLPQAHIPMLLPTLHQGQSLPATAIDQDGATVLDQGKLNFISNEINSDTGSIMLKAIFANDDERLYPNQFVNVRMQTGTLKNATVIPAQALQLSSDGDFVYVIKADNTVARRAVKTGPAFGDSLQAVLSGVAMGENVVTEGIDRLTTGSKVSVVNDATATDNKAPLAAPAADPAIKAPAANGAAAQ